MAQAAGNKPLDGTHAVVTGASRGIGAAVVRALAGAGASVTLMARDLGALLERAAELGETFSQSFLPISVDVTQSDSVRAGFAEARAGLGDPAILVNNAGGVETVPFGSLERAHWDHMIALNLTSVYLCCREVLPAMVETGGGHIVTVASTAGLEGYPYVAAYTAAKHGAVGLTRSLARETAGTGVTVNAVCPGFTDTDLVEESARHAAEKTGRSIEEVRAEYAQMNPSGRLITPAEVAERVVWLCLPEQHTKSGEALVVS
ncbi:MAG: SDR family oxidoreductase [Candidatus Krumholzibacteriota bacterium]|nr:SDR family oxidoreductase [Candidatus Krumholzibacteriota bacterium]